jgi:hypothetical protein
MLGWQNLEVEVVELDLVPSEELRIRFRGLQDNREGAEQQREGPGLLHRDLVYGVRHPIRPV